MNSDLIIENEEELKNKIYTIRGQQVMLDSDLAKLYGYTTKDFNRQIKNNIEKFDSDFMFQLNTNEYENILRCKNFTSSFNNNYGGRRYMPYVFTEQGIYMLMTVLKGKKAIEQSKALIRIFKKMKDYLTNNNLLNIVLKHDNEIANISDDIKHLQESFDKLEEKEMKNKLIFDGKIYDAHSKIIDILNKTNKEIIIIDNYADKTVLDIVSKIKKDVILITRKNNLLNQIDIDKYNKQYHNLKIIYDNSFHDRFIILDKDKLYQLGSSINYIGNKITAINIIEEEIFKQELFNKLEMLIDFK